MHRLRLLILTLVGSALASPAFTTSSSRVVVAWDDPSGAQGYVAAIEAQAPYSVVTTELPTAPDGLVRVAHGRVFHLGRSTGSLTVIDPATWSVERSFAFGRDDLRDIAVASPETAYLSSRRGGHLERLDLGTGALAEAVDLRPLGVGDGNPAMETMLIHRQRLYVQLAGPNTFPPEPHFLAIVDLASESIVDADPVIAGPQAIPLEGTAPRFKMQVIPGTDHLLVSATGAFLDDGGLERVDLVGRVSLGVQVREFVDVGGNDLGAFVMIDSDRGWLVFSTDIVLSSHLHPFTLSAGGERLEAATSLFYFAPALVYDAGTDSLFWPQPGGVRAFDGTTGSPRASSPTPLSGDPTDLVLLRGAAAEPIPIASPAGLSILVLLLTAGGSYLLRRHRARGESRPIGWGG